MTYFFALIGIVAVAFLLWRAFGPDSGVSIGEGRPTPKNTARGPVGPDDDPEFLRDLDRRSRGPNGSDVEDT